jgi:tetratricopeptide (TPR) repeat protein
MLPGRPTATIPILIGFIILTIILLIWSVNQTAVLKVESLAAANRIEELDKEVKALRNMLVRLKIELEKSKHKVSEDVAKDDSAFQSALFQPESEADNNLMESPLVSSHAMSDVEESEKLGDMPQPTQESTGLSLGNSALKDLNYADAIDNFEKVETDTEDYIGARTGIANAYFYSHKFEKAAAEFNHILQQKPDSVEAAIGLANAYLRLSQVTEQISAINKAIAIEPEQWLHYNNRATAYLMNGDHEQAKQDFTEAARLAAPTLADQASAMENVGLIHLREEYWGLAYEHANKVNSLDAKHSWNWLIRGIAAAKLKQNVDAYVSFDEWFKYKRATDPYLLKQVLPESLYVFIDVTPLGLTKLVDPPYISGQRCENNSQCKSYMCRPGPPNNKVNYCVMKKKLCSAPDSNGYLLDEILEVSGVKARCYQPDSANARWTRVE